MLASRIPRPAFVSVWLTAVAGLSAGPSVPAGPAAEQAGPGADLRPGARVEGVLAPGEERSHSLSLTPGDFAVVVVEAEGAELTVAVRGPDGDAIVEMPVPAGAGEDVPFVAEAEGRYLVAAKAGARSRGPGRYLLTWRVARPADARDRDRAAAARLESSARRSRAVGTGDALRTALDQNRSARTLWRAAGDRAGEARTAHEAGAVLYLLGEPKEALDPLREALALFQALGDRRREAACLNALGSAHQMLGQTKEALERYRQALPTFEGLGDARGQGVILQNLGWVHQNSGELRTALEHYQRALPFLRAAGEVPAEAQVLNNMASVHEVLGEGEAAFRRYDEALALRRSIGDGRGEAQTLNFMGHHYVMLGRLQEALDCHWRALPLARRGGDRQQEAYTLKSLGEVYDELGNDRAAIQYYEEALAIARPAGVRILEAYVLNGIGAIHQERGETAAALAAYEQALQAVRALGSRHSEAYTLRNAARSRLAAGELDGALGDASRALSLFREVGDGPGEALALRTLGSAYLARRDWARAREHLEAALATSRRGGDRPLEAWVQFDLALVERREGHLAQAQDRLESAVALFESLRAPVASEGLRAFYLAAWRDCYEAAITVLMARHEREPAAGHDARALEMSERSRARSLLELLAEAGADVRAGGDPELVDEERRLQRLVQAREAQLAAVAAGRQPADEGTKLEKELEDLVRQMEEVRGRLKVRSPRYAALTQPRPLSAEAVRSLLDPETLLLEYALGEDSSFLWAVDARRVTAHALPGRGVIEDAARRFYELARTSRKRTTRVPTARAAAELSRVILGPVAERLDGHRRIAMVPDGILHYIPLAALPRPAAGTGQEAARPLVVDHEVVCLPSASVLAILREERRGRPPAPLEVAVLSDPVFDAGDRRVRRPAGGAASVHLPDGSPPAATPRTSSPLPRFERLPYSLQEARAILALAPPDRTLAALGFAASRQTATGGELASYRIVHFATHGLLDAARPEMSGIVLSLVDEDGQPQDGFLRAHELFNLRLGADLVVLSACQTALGHEVRGEGLVGLTRGFMYAGAPRVMASLWNVQDESTAELMGRFYRGLLKEGRSPAAALRSAQASMWSEPRWRAPYHWAGFVLQGEWR